MAADNQYAHRLIDQLRASQFAAVIHLLEVMIDQEDDDLTEEDVKAIEASREYFREGHQGVSFEELASECGLDVEKIEGTTGTRA